VNYGIQGDTADQLVVAEEFQMAKGVPLPEIAQAYKANAARNLWTKSDEEGSFSQTAEKAFYAKALKAWFYTLLVSTGFQTNVDTAERNFQPVKNRIKAMGGSIGLVGPK